MRRIHIALGVSNISQSVKDYSRRLGCKPVTVVPREYALWRTRQINFSIRRVRQDVGALRHLGWEDASVSEFSKDSDINGIVWESFNAALQAAEIKAAWPQSNYKAGPTKRANGRRSQTGRRR